MTAFKEWLETTVFNPDVPSPSFEKCWDAALEERDKAWQSWRKQLLDAWANDHRATMTALLEGGPELKEQK